MMKNLEESIMKGTREASGSDTSRLTKRVMAGTPSIRPSSMLMSSTSAPAATWMCRVGVWINWVEWVCGGLSEAAEPQVPSQSRPLTQAPRHPPNQPAQNQRTCDSAMDIALS